MAPGGPRLVLASGSAARRALLAAAGLALADAKAANVMDAGAVVIGTDQFLVAHPTFDFGQRDGNITVNTEH